MRIIAPGLTAVQPHQKRETGGGSLVTVQDRPADSVRFSGMKKRTVMPAAFLAMLGIAAPSVMPVFAAPSVQATQTATQESKVDMTEQHILDLSGLLTEEAGTQLNQELRRSSRGYEFPLSVVVLPEEALENGSDMNERAEKLLWEKIDYQTWTEDGGYMLLVGMKNGQPYVAGLVMAEKVLQRFPSNRAAQEYARTLIDEQRESFRRMLNFEGPRERVIPYAVGMVIKDMAGSTIRHLAPRDHNMRPTLESLKPLVVATPYTAPEPAAPAAPDNQPTPTTPPASPTAPSGETQPDQAPAPAGSIEELYGSINPARQSVIDPEGVLTPDVLQYVQEAVALSNRQSGLNSVFVFVRRGESGLETHEKAERVFNSLKLDEWQQNKGATITVLVDEAWFDGTSKGVTRGRSVYVNPEMTRNLTPDQRDELEKHFNTALDDQLFGIPNGYRAADPFLGSTDFTKKVMRHAIASHYFYTEWRLNGKDVREVPEISLPEVEVVKGKLVINSAERPMLDPENVLDSDTYLYALEAVRKANQLSGVNTVYVFMKRRGTHEEMIERSKQLLANMDLTEFHQNGGAIAFLTDLEWPDGVRGLDRVGDVYINPKYMDKDPEFIQQAFNVSIDDYAYAFPQANQKPNVNLSKVILSYIIPSHYFWTQYKLKGLDVDQYPKLEIPEVPMPTGIVLPRNQEL